METKDIRQLAELMREMDLTSLEISEGDSLVRLERGGRPVAVPHTESTAPAGGETAPEVPEAAQPSNLFTVTSPMVGVFYAAPAPDMKPYVAEGDTVKAGDVLCIIEAMKIMNEITAERDGTVVEICAKNKQVVDFDHPLFRLHVD